jgi:hypothetical protein
MLLLARVLARRSFELPEFELRPLEFESEAHEELAELLLDEPIAASATNVVAIRRTLPTPGELRDSIERHLRAKATSDGGGEHLSPADELRLALAELRQSLA